MSRPQQPAGTDPNARRSWGAIGALVLLTFAVSLSATFLLPRNSNGHLSVLFLGPVVLLLGITAIRRQWPLRTDRRYPVLGQYLWAAVIGALLGLIGLSPQPTVFLVVALVLGAGFIWHDKYGVSPDASAPVLPDKTAEEKSSPPPSILSEPHNLPPAPSESRSRKHSRKQKRKRK